MDLPGLDRWIEGTERLSRGTARRDPHTPRVACRYCLAGTHQALWLTDTGAVLGTRCTVCGETHPTCRECGQDIADHDPTCSYTDPDAYGPAYEPCDDDEDRGR